MRIAAAVLAALVSLSAQAQTWRLAAPDSVNVGDLVSLRLTRDGAPQSGVVIRVAAPAREIATVRAASADLRAFPTAESDLKGALYRGDNVLVTLNTAGEWCGVLTAWGADGHLPCAALAIRAFGQPVGTTDSDGRVLSRDLALVPSSIDLIAERNGEPVANATVRVRPDESEALAPLGPGVTLLERRFVRANDGIFTLRVLEFDPAAPHLFMLPARAFDRAIGTEPTSNLARRFGALAAINGAPFVPNGPYAGAPTGAYQWNGQIVAGGGASRAALLLCDPRSPRRADFDTVDLRARVTAADGQALDLQGINRPRTGSDDLVLYTPFLGPRTLTAAGGQEAVLDLQNRVNSLAEANAEIPSDGSVLSGAGTAAAFLRDRASVGSALRIEASLAPQTTPAVSGCQATDIIAAGPLLVDNAQPVTSSDPDATIRTARSAFALTDRNTWLFVTVDGRQASSAGLRLAEFADELVRLGVVRAVNLDGGNSTTLVVNDVVRNQPSAGEESEVGDALLLFSVQDIAGLRYLVDRVVTSPFQVPFDVTQTIQASMIDAYNAIDNGDTIALRAAMEKLRNDLLRLNGRDLPAAPGRVLLRAVETFMLTLAPIQTPPNTP